MFNIFYPFLGDRRKGSCGVNWMSCKSLLLSIGMVFFLPYAYGEAPPRVIASFSILGDLVAQVGGERIDLQVLVGPDQDAHMYQPRPADSARLSQADLVVVNGLGFEGWIDRLIQASGYQGPVIVATEGLSSIPMAEDFLDPDDITQADPQNLIDPHAWQSPKKVHTYIQNILQGLITINPAAEDYYRKNARVYLAELDALDQKITAALAAIPAQRRTVVTSHDAFGYFAADYGLTFLAPQGMSTESEASAREVATLIEQIREKNITALFVENISDGRLLEQIARETGVSIGGTLYSDALSKPEGEAGTYLTMLRHNLDTLLSALQPSNSEAL